MPPTTGRSNRRSRTGSRATGVQRSSVVTVPCAGLDELCNGADAYVQTVIREDLVRKVPNTRFQDIVDYHSTVEDAARTAARAGVRTLVLTHYVPPMAADGRMSGARSPRSTSQAGSCSGTTSRSSSSDRAGDRFAGSALGPVRADA